MGRIEFVGVDGCRAGWFSVGFDALGGYELRVFPMFSELLAYYHKAKLVLVDIPIGLPEGSGGRCCDNEARKVLGSPRSSSVFSAPTRQTVQYVVKSPKDDGETAYRAANNIERQIAMKGISRQSFAIAPKIGQVDRALSHRSTNVTPEVREAHPEVCFWALDKGRSMEHGKKRKNGQEERIRVLGKIEQRTQAIFEEAYSMFLRKCVARDDILDALVAAVTALHGHDSLKTIPKCPPMDSERLPMEMVYYDRE